MSLTRSALPSVNTRAPEFPENNVKYGIIASHEKSDQEPAEPDQPPVASRNERSGTMEEEQTHTHDRRGAGSATDTHRSSFPAEGKFDSPEHAHIK